MCVIGTQNLYVVKKQIARYGQECEFKRAGKNEFGESLGEYEIAHACKGLFHVSGGHLQVSIEDKGLVQSRKTPMVLILYTDAIHIDNIVSINGTDYRVTGILDLGNEHVLLDVSLGGDVDD